MMTSQAKKAKLCTALLASVMTMACPQIVLAQSNQSANTTLSIGHEANPDDIEDFTYSIDGMLTNMCLLDDDATATGGGSGTPKSCTLSVGGGDYEITQVPPSAGWVLTSIQCSGTQSQFVDLANRKVALNVAAGAQAVCKFRNERSSTQAPGKIVIRNQTSPDDVQDFMYSGTGPNFNETFPLDDDLTATGGNTTVPRERFFSNLQPGIYKFTQAPSPAGWVLTGINCPGSGPQNPAATPNLSNRSVQINLAAGQEVQCDFIQARPTSEIRIIKDATPNSTQDFGFTGSGPGFSQSFTLDDDSGVTGADNQYQSSRAFTVAAGQYVFTEAHLQGTGWTLAGISCSPNAAAVVDQKARKVTVTVANGQTVTCTYSNKQLGGPPPPPPPCPGSYPTNVTVNLFSPGWQSVSICRGGTVTFTKAGGGSFTITPTVPAGSFTPLTMPAGAATATTTPFPNQTAGPITYKYSVAPGAPQGSIIVY